MIKDKIKDFDLYGFPYVYGNDETENLFVEPSLEYNLLNYFITDGINILIRGDRGVGKTSLVNKLQLDHVSNKGILFIPIPMKWFENQNDFHKNFLQKFSKTVSTEFDEAQSILEKIHQSKNSTEAPKGALMEMAGITKEDIIDFLNEIYLLITKVHCKYKNIVFLIEDIHLLPNDLRKKIFIDLKHILEKSYVTFLLTERIIDIDKKENDIFLIENDFEKILLGNLGKSTIRKVLVSHLNIVRKIKNNSIFPFCENSFGEVYDISDGNPGKFLKIVRFLIYLARLLKLPNINLENYKIIKNHCNEYIEKSVFSENHSYGF